MALRKKGIPEITISGCFTYHGKVCCPIDELGRLCKSFPKARAEEIGGVLENIKPTEGLPAVEEISTSFLGRLLKKLL